MVIYTPYYGTFKSKGEPNCVSMNGVIKAFFLFVNLIKIENFFPVFRHKGVIYLSKLKILSVLIPDRFCFLLSLIFTFPICA